MNMNLRCKLCESPMEVEYKNTDRAMGDIIATCTNCDATGTFVCSSDLLNKNKLTKKETNLVLIATLQAASSAKIR